MAMTRPVPQGTAPVLASTTTAEAVARLPRALAFRLDVLPLSVADGILAIAVPDITDFALLDQLRGATRLKLAPIAMPRDQIRDRLRSAYGDAALPGVLAQRAADSPAVRAVDTMFSRAIAAHASDIHVEPRAGSGRVRLRIDGILREIEAVPSDLFASFVSRIKLIAGMDIADKRQPQDGRATVAFDKREIDTRVSSVPTIDGEKLVIRLLDSHSQTPELAQLGMPADMLQTYRSLVQSPWGFIVVAGPTGSGKTTTLYASLAELDATSKNVCSVEDPIEMRLAGVAQVQINPRAGISFPTVLRSFMRQDPNVIMVGEMRDAETAAVAVSASLAGQLVFTTLHANDAARTVERLIELGVARHSLAAGLTGILAQRLVRRLCDQCCASAPIPEHLRRVFDTAQTQWHIANGCRTCANTGYIGRVGVYELLVVNDDLRDAIATGASSVHVAQIGKQAGYRPMIADGMAKVLGGTTTFDELRRVVAWSNAR
jgi:type IV pilus assembly protein PilB